MPIRHYERRGASSGATVTWGSITGTLSNQTDLQSALDAKIANLLEDTTPQLGGNLDVNGNKIVSTSNGNIDIEPNGTGNVLLGNMVFDADQTIGAGQDNYVLTYDNATGLISLEAAAAGGATTLDGLTDVTITSVADDDMLFYDATSGQWKNTANLAWDDSALKLYVGANFQMADAGGTPGTSGVFHFYNGVGTSWMSFHDTDTGYILINNGPLRLTGQRIDIWPTGGTPYRSYFYADASSSLRASAENSSALYNTGGLIVEYPLTIEHQGTGNKPTTTPVDSLSFWTAAVNTNTDPVLHVSNEFEIAYPVDNRWEIAYQKSNTTTAPPTTKQIRTNSTTWASITTLYCHDTAYDETDAAWFWNRVKVNDILFLSHGHDKQSYGVFTVDSITDSTGYYTIGVTYLYGGTTATTKNSGDMRISFQKGAQNMGLSSDDLSDVASIAMLDEAETVTGAWTFSGAGVFSTSLNAVPLARSVAATGNTATTDYGIVIRFTGGSGATFTLDGDPPTNSVVLLDNSSGASWTIAASTSLIWAKDATTGNRTLADDGIAVAVHRGSGTWIINGSALLT